MGAGLAAPGRAARARPGQPGAAGRAPGPDRRRRAGVQPAAAAAAVRAGRAGSRSRSEPKRADKARLQLLSALLPLAFGAVLWVVLKNALFALFMLMSPVMVIGQWISERRHGRRSYQRGMKEYRRTMAGLDGTIAAAPGGRRGAAPGRGARPGAGAAHRDRPAAAAVGAPRRRPRRAAPAARAGRPAGRHRVRPGEGRHRRRRAAAGARGAHVPIALPLPELGVVGLAGPGRRRSRALARWFVAQAAALHSPRDLHIVVLAASPQAGAELELGPLAAALRAAAGRGLPGPGRRRPGVGGAPGGRAGRARSASG